MIAISSLNDQYGCSSFCTSSFVYGQPCNTYSDSLPKSSSSAVAILIPSAVMQSGISLLHLLLCSFQVFPCLCLSCGSIWLANLQRITVVHIFAWFLCCVDESTVISFVVSVIGFVMPFLKIATSSLWSAIMQTLPDR